VKKALGAAALVAAALVACSSVKNSECDCLSPTLQVSVPPESAGAVAEMRVSGPACAGATVTCAQDGIGGCASWRFAATAAGNCHIDVLFNVGTTFAQDVAIVETKGCCAGLYPDPESAGTINVPTPAGSPDGGSTNDAGEGTDAKANDAGEGADSSANDAASDAGDAGAGSDA
jgi:hypothetical protein